MRVTPEGGSFPVGWNRQCVDGGHPTTTCSTPALSVHTQEPDRDQFVERLVQLPFTDVGSFTHGVSTRSNIQAMTITEVPQDGENVNLGMGKGAVHGKPLVVLELVDTH